LINREAKPTTTKKNQNISNSNSKRTRWRVSPVHATGYVAWAKAPLRLGSAQIPRPATLARLRSCPGNRACRFQSHSGAGWRSLWTNGSRCWAAQATAGTACPHSVFRTASTFFDNQLIPNYRIHPICPRTAGPTSAQKTTCLTAQVDASPLKAGTMRCSCSKSSSKPLALENAVHTL
jgi:hypothetical protein